MLYVLYYDILYVVYWLKEIAAQPRAARLEPAFWRASWLLLLVLVLACYYYMCIYIYIYIYIQRERERIIIGYIVHTYTHI